MRWFVFHIEINGGESLMSLLVFFVLTIVLLYITFEVSNKDILSPGVLLLLGYLAATVFGIYNVERWKTNISDFMLIVVSLGIMFFVIGDVLGRKIRIHPSKTKNNISSMQLKNLEGKQGLIKLAFVSLLCLLFTYLVWKEMVRIAYADFKSWENIVYNYKINKANYAMSGLGKWAGKLTKASAYVYLLVFANNITQSEKFKLKNIKKNITYLIPGAFYCVQQLILGARIGVIGFMVSIAFSIGICRWIKYRKVYKINISTLIKGFVGAMVICVCFFKIKELVGRQQESLGVLDYVATYLGGSFDLFSQYMRETRGAFKGYESFSGVVDNLQSYFGVLKNVTIVTSHEFRNATTGVTIGNTYTGFRNYYNDYGIFGVCILSNILAVIFSSTYARIKRLNRVKQGDLVLIVFYSTQIFCMPFHFFTDYFFPRISLNMAIDFMLIVILTCFVFNKKDLILKAEEIEKI